MSPSAERRLKEFLAWSREAIHFHEIFEFGDYNVYIYIFFFVNELWISSIFSWTSWHFVVHKWSTLRRTVIGNLWFEFVKIIGK